MSVGILRILLLNHIQRRQGDYLSQPMFLPSDPHKEHAIHYLLSRITSSMDAYPFFEKRPSKSSSYPNAKAIFISEDNDISPVRSKRFSEPRLTSAHSANCTCVIFFSFLLALMRPAISLFICSGDFKKEKLFIANILAQNTLFFKLWLIFYPFMVIWNNRCTGISYTTVIYFPKRLLCVPVRERVKTKTSFSIR